MTSVVKFLFAVLFLGIVVHSNARHDYSPLAPYERHDWECTPWDNITVTTVETGLIVNETKQWKVTFTNVCRCAQLNILIDTEGFTSKEDIDPQILDLSDPLSTLNDIEGGLQPYASVSFTYAADTAFDFEGVTCDLECPALAPSPLS